MTYLKKDVYGFRKSKKALVSAVIATGLFSFGLTPSVAASDVEGTSNLDRIEEISEISKEILDDLIIEDQPKSIDEFTSNHLTESLIDELSNNLSDENKDLVENTLHNLTDSIELDSEKIKFDKENLKNSELESVTDYLNSKTKGYLKKSIENATENIEESKKN